MKNLSFIIAVDSENYGIGYQGKMSWHVPSDLAFFKEKTLNKTLVMGRKTVEKLPHLPNRNILVFTKENKSFNDINEQKLIDSQYPLILAGGAQLLNLAIENSKIRDKISYGWITYITFKNQSKVYDVHIEKFVKYIENNFRTNSNEDIILADNEHYYVIVKKYYAQVE